MHASRRLVLLSLVALLAAPTSGCLANMDQLKTALGYHEAPPEPTPLPEPVPPVARAAANLTLTATGAAVRFSGERSHDADGGIVAWRWDFGDGARGEGRVVEHAFARPGEYAVTLTVEDADGLAATDGLVVTVRAPNRVPVAVIDVQDESGRPASSGDVGRALLVSAARSHDPDGGPLAYDWDFGNGVTAHAERASVTYDRPGRYVVTLAVRDAGGATATASVVLAQGLDVTFAARLAATDEASSHVVPVPRDANVVVRLAFDSGLGTDDLDVVLLDAAGREVARTSSAVAPPARGAQEKTLALPADALASFAPGDWTVRVEKTSGIQADYTVAVSVRP